MLNTAVLLLSIVSSANAETPPEPLNLETPPVYFSVRGAVAVPANANGDVKTAGFALGVELDEMNTMGLRVIYMDDPPDNPLATSTPHLPWAWGPVLDWQHHFQPNSAFNFYTNVSLGYVYGVPNTETSGVEEDNVILPIIEGGVGVRLSKQTDKGSRLFVSPELGFVPGAVAPYASVSLGVIRPAR
jgi:hypothetical protein